MSAEVRPLPQVVVAHQAVEVHRASRRRRAIVKSVTSGTVRR